MDNVNTYKVNKEAVKKIAEKVYDNGSTVINRNDLEEMFPELAESKDEKIRKAIIEHIDCKNKELHIDPNQSVTVSDAIAWLEKHKYTEDDLDKAYKCADEVQYRRSYEDAKKEIEKQGEQKPNTCENCGIATNNCQKFPCTIRDGEQKLNPVLDIEIPFGAKDSELQDASYYIPEGFHAEIEGNRVVIRKGEQKPDKVEPKFKNGQWIVWQNKCYKVNYNGCGYELIDQNGLSTSLEYVTVDENAHLWTIQDAKDGDMLFQDLMGGKTFIYNGINSNMAILYSFIISNDSEDVLPYHIGKPNTGIGNIEDNKNIIHPATKEQRDTLEKAMADAGYTFDFEKKELKKIVVPIFKIGDTIIKKHNSDILYFGSFTITDITGGKYWYNDRIICDITEQDEWEIYEPVSQKSAEWSEEDEERLSDAIFFVREYQIPTRDKRLLNAAKETEDWLRTFKGRVQPKQEWSEEDDRALKSIINDISKGVVPDEEDTNWLKSLRPQSQWKPSEGQLECLGYAIEKAEKDWSPLINNRIYLTLKALKEQLEKLQ